MEILRIRDKLTNSNCYIIAEQGKAVVIDPNHPTKIIQEIIKRELVPEYVLLTHEHCDHIQGLSALRKAWPVLVVAQKKCSEGMQSVKKNMSGMMEVYLYFKSGGTVSVQYTPFVCEPADCIFETKKELFLGENKFVMVSAPGHTHGSSCIFLHDQKESDGSKYLFSGDYFLPGEQVITRLPGGSEEEYEQIGRPWLAELPEGLIVLPGHGDRFVLTEEVKKAYGL